MASSAGWSTSCDRPSAAEPPKSASSLGASLSDDRRGLRRCDARRRVGVRPSRRATATASSRPTPMGSTRLAGLTLLEAAAVGGDAARRRGARVRARPGLRREPQPGRVAVAMSGGVDSAVTLLRAAPNAIGVTLRLWQDPAAPDAERACCSSGLGCGRSQYLPRARAPARDARPPRGVQERGRRAVRRRVRGGRDPEPLHSLQRRVSLRRAARVRRAGGCGDALDRALRTHRRARRDSARRARRRMHGRISRTCSRRWIRARSPGALPARRADEGGDARRGRSCRARRGHEGREPGGVLPRRRRLSRLPRTAGATASFGRRSSTRTAPVSARTTGTGASRPGSAAVWVSPRRARSTSCGRIPGRTRSSSVSTAALAATRIEASGRLYVAGLARRGQAPLRLAAGPDRR